MGVHGFTVYDMIARSASAYGGAPAIIQGDRPVSFGEFKDRADTLAGGLSAPGFRPFESLSGAARGPAAADVSPADPFAVISTAAVDVVPRGAVLTHANIIAANLTVMAGFGLTPADHYLLALPLFHIT